MENNPDFRMAMLLQKQFDMEFSVERPPIDLTYEKIEKPKKSQSKSKDHSTKGSLIDPSWELVDPTPNIHLLFTQFNERFFWAKLVVVTVSWSKRMTTCAGICSYQGRAGICKITLSEPLLKLRPRKDLIETLLHEMIHAYLFVTHNNKDRDGHGPEFHKHMYRINGEAGTNITVYHDFHDEVRLYKQHWWRCNGPCQKRPPFFGMVRRAMNRAPGPNDRWFPQHQQTCSGTFIKVKEPEKVVKKKDEKIKKNNNGDITKFIKTTKNTTINTLNNTSNSFGTKNKNGTIVINPKTAQKDKENINNNTINKPSTSTSNIVGFSDLTKPVSNPTLFTGPGQTLDQNKPSNSDYSTVRNHWLNKFSKESISKVDTPNLDLTTDSSASKKRKIEETTPKSTDKTIKLDQINCPNCNKSIEQSKINAHLDLCLNADLNITAEFTDDSFNTIHCPVCNMSIDEDLLNRHLDLCLNGDDKCRNDDDKKVPTNEPVSTELIQCEVCDEFIAKISYETHAQVCLDKLFSKYEESNSQMDEVNCLVCGKKLIKSALNEHLEECMGTVFEKNLEVNEENEEIEEEVVKFNCPICMSQVEEQEMNEHIDKCLQQKEIVNEFCD